MKLLSIGIIIGNLFFLTIDMARSNDILGAIVFRVGISCFVIVGVLNSHLVKEQNSNSLQLITFILNIGLIIGFFLAHTFVELPEYSLPNAIYTLMFLAVILSGQRFKISLLYSVLVIACYILFSTQVFSSQYLISQINNLIINIIVILVGAYMIENFRRNVFVTNHIIALQKKDLLASNDLKNRLLSILSHDLRGPIKRLIVILNLWRGRKIDKNELLDYTQKIEIEIETTASLMDNLLFWSKSKMEGNQKTYQVANAYEVAKETIAIFKDHIKAKNIRCQNLIDPSKIIQTEVNILSLCLRNLISNAIKYTPKKGIIEIGMNRTNEFAEFFVSDSGVGISCECYDRYPFLMLIKIWIQDRNRR